MIPAGAVLAKNTSVAIIQTERAVLSKRTFVCVDVNHETNLSEEGQEMPLSELKK